MSEILNLFDMNTTTPINCQVWVTFTAIFGYMSLAAASLLIVLRVVAIWDKNKIVVAVAASLWVTHVAAMIQSAARLRASWSTALPGCIVFNTDGSKLNMIVFLITDLVLLLTMLGGLLRFRRAVGGTCGVGRLLWNQGVIWLLLATAAEVPPLVLIALDLNVPLDLMFQPPSLIALSIAATRMHRSLTDFVVVPTDMNSNVTQLHCNQTPFNRIQVTVDTSSDAYQLSRTSQHDLCIKTEQPCEKPNGYEPRPRAVEPV